MQPSSDAPEKKPKSRLRYFWPLVIIWLIVSTAFIFSILGRLNSQAAKIHSEAEIKSLSNALEAYKADHGNYPSDPDSTELLLANGSSDPADYIASSAFLYRALAGYPKAANQLDRTVYFPFPSNMLKADAKGRIYIADPWGNSYGYSTFKAVHPDIQGGYNATFDLWSTGGEERDGNRERWIDNWQTADANTGN